MASPGFAVPSFRKDRKFLDGLADATLEVRALDSLEVTRALAENRPFPPGVIRLGAIAASVAGGSGELKLAVPNGPAVTFRGSARGGGALGVYSTSADLVEDIGGEDGVVNDGIDFPDSGTDRYLALRWHYDVHGAAGGAVALGHAAAKFGVEGSSAGQFVAIRRFEADPNAREGVQALLDAWVLPARIGGPDDLAPGTWIVAEADGGFKASLGASIGLDYSWIRSTKLHGLSGDLGLRIQAAVDATVRFEAAGKYAMVVSRESLDPASSVIRLRLEKLAKKGWSFALNAAAGMDPQTGSLTPESMDDFLSAILGIHGAQIVEDLREIRRWTDPRTPLNTLAGDFLVEVAKKQFARTFRARPEEAFAEAHRKVTGFLDAWSSPQLGHRAATLLWSLVRRGEGLADLEPTLRSLAAGDAEGIRAVIRTALSTAEAVPGPARVFLEAVTPAGALAAIDRIADIDRIRGAAQIALDILDGKVLNELAAFAEERFGIRQIREADFDDLDKRLKEKLSKFLGRVIDRTSLEEVRAAMNAVLGKAGDIYRAAREAANRRYEADFLYTYQSATARSALLDITFDFGANPELGPVLRRAIAGDFSSDGILTTPIAGVTLYEGRLTHGITRQSAVEVALPYFGSRSGSITQSLAALQVHAEGSRITLDSSNETFRRGRWAGRLALTMDIPAAARQGIRRFAEDEDLGRGMAVTYSFHAARKALRAVQLERQLRPIVESYLPAAFGDGKATLEEWVSDLDKHADAVENNGTGLIGNTLLSLDVSMPGRVLAGWWNAPADPKAAVWRALSRNIQRTLRWLVPYTYFQDLKRYAGQNPAACAVMLYSSLPPASSVRLENDRVRFNTKSSYYWNFRDDRRDGDFDLMIRCRLTTANLALRMDEAHTLLANTPELRSQAGFFVPAEFSDVKRAALTGPGRMLLRDSLLFAEAETIKGAVDAGIQIARFRQSRDDEAALEALDRFGAGVVETFNKSLTSLFDSPGAPQLLRNLGLMVFLEASRALHPSLGTVNPAARLDIRILRDGAEFPPPGFPNDYRIDPADVVLAQPILSVA